MALTIVIRERKPRRDFALERSSINHLLFTDDLKLHVKDQKKLYPLVKIFSLGISRCADEKRQI